MYDMTRVTAKGYNDAADNADARHAMRQQLNAQRTEDYRNGTYALAGGVPDTLPADAPQFMKDYHAFYKTPRGYHKRSLGSNGGWNVTSSLSLINQPILAYAPEIRSAVLLREGPLPLLQRDRPQGIEGRQQGAAHRARRRAYGPV